jgi:hypothetical protein
MPQAVVIYLRIICNDLCHTCTYVDTHVDAHGLSTCTQDELSDLSEQQVKHMYGHSGSITALSFTPDQQMLLSSSTDGTVRLWTTQWHKNLAAYKYVGWGGVRWGGVRWGAHVSCTRQGRGQGRARQGRGWGTAEQHSQDLCQ